MHDIDYSKVTKRISDSGLRWRALSRRLDNEINAALDDGYIILWKEPIHNESSLPAIRRGWIYYMSGPRSTREEEKPGQRTMHSPLR